MLRCGWRAVRWMSSDIFEAAAKPVAKRTAEKLTKVTKKNIKGSQKKINPLCRLIAGLSYEEASRQLSFSPKRAARQMKPLLEHGRTIAENRFQVESQQLRVKEAYCTKGRLSKTMDFRARGRSNIMLHRWSHVTIVLEVAATHSAH